ncbi:DUF6602 domain-containing protein [Pseudomonas proteolytica]|uniref:DUF6602 domain-containing protein n=1 Tax=Pseudomonas proteolytica TaxID=219574 RepID=UPI0030EF1A84
MEKTFSVSDYLSYLAEGLVHNFNRAGAATTPGLVGGARETEVRRQLTSLLPEKVTVATGCVIDTYGSTSAQTDVIIHEKDNCPVFSINQSPEATYIPCESVAAIGEIKSDLGTKELEDAVRKIRSVKQLRRAVDNPNCFRQFGSSLKMHGAPQEMFDPDNKISDAPYGFILCKSFALKPETLVKNYWAACSNGAPQHSPSVLVSLADGVVMFVNAQRQFLRNARGATHAAIFRHPGSEFQYLLSELIYACQHGRTSDVLPHYRYVLGEHVNSTVQSQYYPLS